YFAWNACSSLKDGYWPSGSPDCPVAGDVWNDATKLCGPPPCDGNAPALTGGWVEGDWATDTSLPTSVCSDGCGFSPSASSITQKKIDGVWWSSVKGFAPTGSACVAGDGSGALGNPPSDGDGDGSSDGTDGAPNNPGVGGGGGEQAEDGSGSGTNEPGGGDGNGNTSGGGGDCKTQPTSTGNAITAQIAYQTWATRCAIESLKDGNGNVKTTGTGTATGTGGTGTGTNTEPGSPSAGVGTLYTKNGDTIESVYAEFKTAVSGSALVTAGAGVFSGCSGGGSCPMETWNASGFDIVQDLSALCGGTLSSLISFAGYIALAGFAFFAFKVALL
ncbi:MAG: hypothetical protein ACOH2M_05210, partial [Cypionkella sp.]